MNTQFIYNAITDGHSTRKSNSGHIKFMNKAMLKRHALAFTIMPINCKLIDTLNNLILYFYHIEIISIPSSRR